MNVNDAEIVAAARTIARLSRTLERTATGIPLAHYRMLAVVQEGGERASRLASRLSVTKPTVTATVDALVKTGLLERARDERDKRVIQLFLTPAGEQALAAADVAFAARLGPLLQHTSDPRQFLEMLAEIDDGLNDQAAGRGPGSDDATPVPTPDGDGVIGSAKLPAT